MNVTVTERLVSAGRELEMGPGCWGALEDSSGLLGDTEALRMRMAEEGYLYLPGYLETDLVRAARHEMASRLAAEGQLDPAFPMDACRVSPTAHMGFRPDLAAGNEPLHQLLYDGRMMDFYAEFLGGPVRHYDFTWIRAVSPGQGTPPHCDIVYMGRGTTRLYTSWTPLGDVPYRVGGLMILERSHRHDRLNEGYGRKDVDKYCTNRRDEAPQQLGGGGNIRPGGLLSPDPVKLRQRLGGRWLSAEYKMGDLLVFSVYTVHASLDNGGQEIRLSSDTRYQLASEPVDERWIGENPIAHGPAAKRGMIC